VGEEETGNLFEAERDSAELQKTAVPSSNVKKGKVAGVKERMTRGERHQRSPEYRKREKCGLVDK